MRQWRFLLANLVIALAAFAEDELPAPDPDLALEIEPPLLIDSRKADRSPVLTGTANLPTSDPDLAKLERDLTRAKRNASGAEQLYRAGIISKVEAEDRVLKVVRLEAKSAEAGLQVAKRDAESDARKTQAVAEAEAAAAHAAGERQHAELEAALRNLQRQQKLLALGSGRKADVNRAEQRLAELQHP